MKKFAICLLAASMLGAIPAAAQELSITSSEPLRLPAGRYFGEIAGVATAANGDIYIYQRAGRPVASIGGARVFTTGGSELVRFDRTGKYISTVNDSVYGFLVASSVRVDARNNVWAVDRASGMVMEFSPDMSRIVMLLGRKPESINVPGGAGRGPAPAAGGRGAGGAAAAGGRGAAPAGGGRGGRGGPPGAGAQQDAFPGPTDVAFDAAGNIFVADGIGANNRVAKFSPLGVFIKSFGLTGSGNDAFNGVRSIATDASGNVYVADAGNKRVQVLDNDLNYKSSITGVGTPAAVCVSRGAHPYLFVSNSNPVNDIDTGGEIYRLELSGAQAGRFGRAGKAAGEFGTVNQIDCRTPNVLYTAEVGNYRVQKITLR